GLGRPSETFRTSPGRLGAAPERLGAELTRPRTEWERLGAFLVGRGDEPRRARAEPERAPAAAHPLTEAPTAFPSGFLSVPSGFHRIATSISATRKARASARNTFHSSTPARSARS